MLLSCVFLFVFTPKCSKGWKYCLSILWLPIYHSYYYPQLCCCNNPQGSMDFQSYGSLYGRDLGKLTKVDCSDPQAIHMKFLWQVWIILVATQIKHPASTTISKSPWVHPKYITKWVSPVLNGRKRAKSVSCGYTPNVRSGKKKSRLPWQSNIIWTQFCDSTRYICSFSFRVSGNICHCHF